MHRDKSSNTHLVIDSDLGLKLASNMPDLAKSLLQMLVSELPETKANIWAVYTNGDEEELLSITHKLHGGSCYCGVPRLKTAAFQLETALKNGDAEPETIDTMVRTLVFEMEQVLTQYEQSHSSSS